MAQSEPTISSILQELAREYDRVAAEREVLDRVLERRPSQAKDPYASIRNILRYDAEDAGWVRLGGGKLIPRRIALLGLRFRVIPTDEEFVADMLARAWLIPFVSLLSYGYFVWLASFVTLALTLSRDRSAPRPF